jgi:hypothetical protein
MMMDNNPSLHRKLISLYHNIAMGGHSSICVTTKRVRGIFYCKRQQKLIKQFIRECLVCQQNKRENMTYPNMLQPLPIPQKPFIDISMDFNERLSKYKGREVILVVVNKFNKFYCGYYG